MRALIVLAAGLVLAQGFPGTPATTSTPLPELSFNVGTGLIDYEAVCVGQATAVRQARRMTGLSAYRSARWSPDGALLAADVWRTGDNAIRLFRADGTPVGRATRPQGGERDFHPAWSPDGTTLAFLREFGNERSGVWLTSGGVERQISRRHAYALDWSPSGDSIALDVGGEFDNVIELIRPTGELVRRIEIPRGASFEDGVSWSPDGTRLALGGGVMVDRTGNVARYAPPSGNPSGTTYPARMPAWSPDGTFIAYERAPSWSDARTNVRVMGKADLYLVSVLSGSAPVRLTNTPDVSERAPAWRRASGPAGTGQMCVRYGSARRDVIRGTAADDLILAGSGNDLLYGGAGNDYVAGGKGNDAIVGGPGRDALAGDTGNDGFNTRDRNRDYVSGGWGIDRAFADRGRLDTLLGVERIRRR